MYRVVFAVLLLAACTLTGCGGGDEAGRQPVYAVTGTITMHGSPLSGAVVSFAPSDGQPTAVGRTDDNGKFQLTTYEFGDGAAAGAFRVVVSKAFADDGGAAAGGDGGGDDHEAAEEAASGHDADSSGVEGEMVPTQYTRAADTPLSVEVKTSGENNFTLEIT